MSAPQGTPAVSFREAQRRAERQRRAAERDHQARNRDRTRGDGGRER
jgi:hypothetical protein